MCFSLYCGLGEQTSFGFACSIVKWCSEMVDGAEQPGNKYCRSISCIYNEGVKHPAIFSSFVSFCSCHAWAFSATASQLCARISIILVRAVDSHRYETVFIFTCNLLS